MMRLLFWDQGSFRQNFLPLCFNRPLADLRMGVLTFAERWSKALNITYQFKTVEYLQPLYEGVYCPKAIPQSGFRPASSHDEIPFEGQEDEVEVLVFGGLILPEPALIVALGALSISEVFMFNADCWIWKTSSTFLKNLPSPNYHEVLHSLVLEGSVQLRSLPKMPEIIERPESMLRLNGVAIQLDYALLSHNRKSQTLNLSNRIKGNQLFVEDGVVADFAILNTDLGPIYLGKNVQIQEGTVIRGPFAIGEGGQVKLGAHIHSDVSAGPFCRLGGELNRSIIWGYSNKGHFGYMGSSIVGAGCNWGAGTSNSNMKNSFGTIRVKDYQTMNPRDTGLRYFGILMGDYTRTAIHTTLTSGAVIGVACQIMNTQFGQNYISNFTWMKSDQESEPYQLDALLSTLDQYFKHLGYVWNNELEKKVLEKINQIRS